MLPIHYLGLGLISLFMITACASDPTFKTENLSAKSSTFKPPANCRLLPDGSYVCPRNPDNGCADVYLPNGSKGGVCH